MSGENRPSVSDGDVGEVAVRLMERIERIGRDPTTRDLVRISIEEYLALSLKRRN